MSLRRTQASRMTFSRTSSFVKSTSVLSSMPRTFFTYCGLSHVFRALSSVESV